MRPRHYFLVTALLVALSFTLAQGGSRRPGARAPVGPPPGSVPVAHSNNDISAHLDRTTKHLERLLRQGDSTAPSSTGSNVSKSTTGVVPGSNAVNQSSTPAPPHHLIGDPPLPSSITDLSVFNTPPGGTRRPGARPPVYPAPYRPPHHLIGDPPTWPDDLGTYLISIFDPGDDRGLLPGEINIYTGTLNSYGARYWQTVFNWNPTTGFGRSVYWTFGPPSDPSQVDYYYYAPAPSPPPPPPAPAPTATNPAPTQNNNTSVPPNPNDPHIYLAAGPVNQSTGLPSTQAADAAISPIGGQSSSVQTAAESSNVTYLAGSGYPDNSGSGQIASSIGFSPDDFTDDSYAVASLPANGTTQGGLEDNSASGTDPVSPGLADSAEFNQTSEPPASAGIAPSAQGQAQSYLTPSDSEGAAPVVEESPSPESGDVSVAQTDSDSSTPGSGSALPWGLGLAGLLIGAGALAGARKAMTWSELESQYQEDPANSARVWIEPIPPTPEQRQRDLNLEIAREVYQQETQKYQAEIQNSQSAIQSDNVQLQHDAQELPQAVSRLSDETQKLGLDQRELQKNRILLNQDEEKKQQDDQQLQQDEDKTQQIDQQIDELWNEFEKFHDEHPGPYFITGDPSKDAEVIAVVEELQSFLDAIKNLGGEIPPLTEEESVLRYDSYETETEITSVVDPEIQSLQGDVANDQQSVLWWQGDVQGLQDDLNNGLPADIAQQEANIAQQQANEDAAAAQFAAAQQDNAPDPNGGWDPSSDPLSPAPANDPSPDPAPAPNGGWDPSSDPLSPAPANDPVPDPNGGWDPSSDPLSPAPANDPEAPGPPANDPSDPNQGWDTSTDPLSPAPANPDQSEPPPDSPDQQDGAPDAPPAQPNAEADDGTNAPPAQPDDAGNQTGDSQPGPDAGPQDPRMQPFVDRLMAQGYSQDWAQREWENLVNSGDSYKISIVTACLQNMSLDDAIRFADGFQVRLQDSQTVALIMALASGLLAVAGALEYALARAAAADAAGDSVLGALWKGVANYLRGGGAASEDAGVAGSEGAGTAANELGAAREKYVADQLGGRVPESPLQIKTPYGTAQVDVVGPNGELIEVGGPGKALDPGGFGRQMQRLQAAAESTGTKAQFYYDQGTPESILNIARNWLGSENVIPFNSGQ